jgi:hypothetical protein
MQTRQKWKKHVCVIENWIEVFECKLAFYNLFSGLIKKKHATKKNEE